MDRLPLFLLNIPKVFLEQRRSLFYSGIFVKGPEWKITNKSWESIRDQLIYSRVNGGFPHIVVEDGNYERNGELYLKHAYEGMELDLKYVERTMPYIQQLWARPSTSNRLASRI
jgi:spore cortex formation protein SpoVR/YcgB (stage V sporulation)